MADALPLDRSPRPRHRGERARARSTATPAVRMARSRMGARHERSRRRVRALDCSRSCTRSHRRERGAGVAGARLGRGRERLSRPGHARRTHVSHRRGQRPGRRRQRHRRARAGRLAARRPLGGGRALRRRPDRALRRAGREPARAAVEVCRHGRACAGVDTRCADTARGGLTRPGGPGVHGLHARGSEHRRSAPRRCAPVDAARPGSAPRHEGGLYR